MAEYQPGVCNINQAGVDYRRKVGIGGVLFAGLGYAILFPLVDGGVGIIVTSLVLGVGLFIGVLNLLQAKSSFCASHGMSGTQLTKDDSNQAEKVTDDSAITKDKQRSKLMIMQAVAISLVATLAVVALKVAL